MKKILNSYVPNLYYIYLEDLPESNLTPSGTTTFLDPGFLSSFPEHSCLRPHLGLLPRPSPSYLDPEL